MIHSTLQDFKLFIHVKNGVLIDFGPITDKSSFFVNFPPLSRFLLNR